MTFYDALKTLVMMEFADGTYVKCRIKRKSWDKTSLALSTPLDKSSAEFSPRNFKLIKVDEVLNKITDLAALSSDNIMADDWELIVEADV